jgi:topoisomerase-4 subunit A
VNNNAKLYANMEEGFVGIGLKRDDNGIFIGDCSDLSEIIVIGRDGKYRVTKVTDKAFFGKDLLYVGVFNRNDTRTIYNVIYRDGKSSIYYAKRFAVTGITRDREYDITTGAPGSAILWFTANHNGEAETVRVNLRAKPKLKKLSFEYDFSELAIKGKTSRGNLVSKNVIQKIVLKAKGVSTIGGKDIWYDPDIQKLDEDGRGIHLGQFSGEDKVLAVFKNGTYYTTSFDLSNRYQGDLLFIEKLDEMKTFTALYWDAGAKAFYVKRFSFTPSDNTPFLFIAEGKNSFLVDVSADERPQVKVTFKGKSAHREPEIIDAESFIGKKGITAKGKKCSALEVKKVEFIASEVAPEVVEETTPAPAPEPVAEATPAPEVVEAPAPEETPEPATEVVEKPAPAPKAKKKPASKPKPAETIEPKQITPLDIDLGEEDTNITVGKLDLDLPDIGEMDLLEPVARKRTSRKSVKKDPDEPPTEDLTLF